MNQAHLGNNKMKPTINVKCISSELLKQKKRTTSEEKSETKLIRFKPRPLKSLPSLLVGRKIRVGTREENKRFWS
jgi:hypothetical protein